MCATRREWTAEPLYEPTVSHSPRIRSLTERLKRGFTSVQSMNGLLCAQTLKQHLLSTDARLEAVVNSAYQLQLSRVGFEY